MGTPLPDDWKKFDGGRYLSGTEWEYLNALEAAEKHEKPAILVYHRTEKIALDPDDPAFDSKSQQWHQVKQLFQSFANPDGSIKRGYNAYLKLDEFREQLNLHLRAVVRDILDRKTTVLVISPSVPPVLSVPASQVQALQCQAAQELKLLVEFRDDLESGGQGPVMVVIPAGRFLMGSSPEKPERQDNERQHEVEVAPFALGKYAVTFEEYDRFVIATDRKKPSDRDWGRGRLPVINVTWFDAMAYAEWLSQQTGQTYRLPTEAEWEYACRAGTTTPFYFGTTLSTNQANHGFSGRTAEVGQFPANAWGLHGMHGNVWEWTASKYDERYGGAELRGVSDPNSDGSRAQRGGSWYDGPERLRSATRNWNDPRHRYFNGGFRLARTLTSVLPTIIASACAVLSR